jgi:NAD-dependent dihydropyrimidine dehydrogenase PreA subunit
MTYVITAACVDVKDRSCIKECPVDCIYEGRLRDAQRRQAKSAASE